MEGDDLLTKQRALNSLCDYIRDPEHVCEAIKLDTVSIVRKLLFHNDVTVKEKACEVMYHIAGQAIGREVLITKNVIGPMSALFQDDSPSVRLRVHSILARASQSAPVAEEMVEQDVIPLLVELLKSEADEIIEVIQETLNHCFKVNADAGLGAGALANLSVLLDHNRASIRAAAARAIMCLAFTLPGKREAVQVQCIEALVRLLTDDLDQARANAAGALMMIVITTQGKYAVLECKGLYFLLKLCTDAHVEARLYALKALTCLSEAPEGRKMMLMNLDKVEPLCDDPVPSVAAAARKCVQVVNWKP